MEGLKLEHWNIEKHSDYWTLFHIDEPSLMIDVTVCEWIVSIADYYDIVIDGITLLGRHPVGDVDMQMAVRHNVRAVTYACSECEDVVDIPAKQNAGWVSRTQVCEYITRHRRGHNQENATSPPSTGGSNRSINYYEYIESPEWRERAEDAKRKAGNRCMIGQPKKDMPPCSGPLHAHHNTYERLGREFDTDLIILCEYHHGIIHGIERDVESAPGIYLERKDGTCSEISENTRVVIRQTE